MTNASNQISCTLPTPDELATNPRAVPGLKVVRGGWLSNDGTILQSCASLTRWCALYEVVFERDETNDAPR